MDSRHFALVRDRGIPAPYASIQSAINRTLHQESAPATFRVGGLRRSYRGSLTGITAPTSTAEMLLAHQDIVTMAARSLHPGIIDLETDQPGLSLTSLDEEGEDESDEEEGPGPPQDEEGEDGGPGPPLRSYFLCFSLGSSYSLWWIWDGGDQVSCDGGHSVWDRKWVYL